MTKSLGFLAFVLLVGAATVFGEPIWSQDPVQLPNATLNAPYTANLAPYVSTNDGGVVSFNVAYNVQYPNWVTISSTGLLTGTPDTAGTVSLVITANEGNQPVDATVTLIVGNTPPTPTVAATCFYSTNGGAGTDPSPANYMSVTPDQQWVLFACPGMPTTQKK